MPVDSKAAYAAADRIATRRRDAGEDLTRLPDNLLGVVAFARRFQRAAVLEQDLEDAFLILAYLQQDLDRHKLGLMRTARQRKVKFAKLAEWLGLNSKQSAESTLLRLEAANINDDEARPRAEAKVRDQRRQDKANLAAATKLASRIRALVRRLSRYRNALPEDCHEDLDELARAIPDDGPLSPVAVARARELCRELRKAVVPAPVTAAVNEVYSLLTPS